jgi:hypothetical protein
LRRSPYSEDQGFPYCRFRCALYWQRLVHPKIRGDSDAMLKFEAEIDGITINGVDIIRWNDKGKIDDFEVMIAPLRLLT